MRKKVKILKTTLQKLYWDENKSTYTIAKIYRCNAVTITNRLKEFNISRKTSSEARIKYKRFDFSENSIEKAYLIGFRLGDLNVYQTNTNSQLIIVRCHTTQTAQVNLMLSIFSKYGQVSISNSKYGMNINCYLNSSFQFLLPKSKKVPTWINSSKKFIVSFIAGYIDAEGNFILNQNKARLKVDSYDEEILKWTKERLTDLNIKAILRLLSRKGEMSHQNYRWRANLWRLNVNEANSLLQFILLLKPFLKHEKRYNDMLLCENNINTRILYGTVKTKS